MSNLIVKCINTLNKMLCYIRKKNIEFDKYYLFLNNGLRTDFHNFV